MSTFKTYKGYEVSFSEYDGKFEVKVNGELKKFASYGSCKNAIDKAIEVSKEFVPFDAVVV
jgi:hypothetical protein